MLKSYTFAGLLIGGAINLLFQITDKPFTWSLPEILICSALSAGAAAFCALLFLQSPRSRLVGLGFVIWILRVLFRHLPRASHRPHGNP